MSTASAGWGTALRLARRDFSWRFRGLRLLIVCLFLGAGALAAIGTLESTIRAQLSDRGQEILGGDIELSLYARTATDEEAAALSDLGTVSSGMRLQAMALAGAGDTLRSVPINLKSVDARWPLYGEMRLADGRSVAAPAEGEAWVEQGALDRLDLDVGDRFRLGETQVRIGGIIGDEPDRLSEGFALGPPVIVSEKTLANTGLVQFGSMARSKYRVALNAGADPDTVLTNLEQQFPNAGFETRSRERAAPGADRLLANMGEFLSLVGLAALVIAGIGIAGAVSSWLEARRGTIATLKVLGATSTDVMRVHALQVVAAAIVGVGAGLLVGAACVPLLVSLLKDFFPVSAGLSVDPAALFRAAGFALLVAFVFAVPPLLAARHVPAMGLLRGKVSRVAAGWRQAAMPVGAGLIAIAALALLTSHKPLLTAGFLAGAAAVLALLAGIGWLLRRLAARLPRGRGGLSLRMGIGALARPGAATIALTTALGFGLSSFVAIAAIQTSIDSYIEATVPARAPDYFVIDLPREDRAAFDTAVKRAVPGSQVEYVPALRGSVLAYGNPRDMVRVSELDEIPDGAWALRGERGLTYSAALPDGNIVTRGEWWPEDYAGPPLVSVDEELGLALDLAIGDRLVIGLLGVEREAEIASFRRIEWEDAGFNYALVFSPGAIDDAPHNLAASIVVPADADRGSLLTTLARDFAGSAVIEIGPVVAQARDLLDSLGAAILAAASVAVLAGMAVLLGAIAAARARETYDTIILRVLGASRAQLLGALAVRYVLLAALLALVGLLLGGGTAWFVMTGLFDFAFRPDWITVGTVLLAGAILVIGTALAASLPILRARPAQALRGA